MAVSDLDLFQEKMTVEYRLFTQRNNRAPDTLIVSSQDHHRLGQAFFDRFVQEVAPNLEITVSRFSPEGTLFFMLTPGLMMEMKREWLLR